MEVISTRRYEARPPASSVHPKLYDPENSIATVKEEEWETRKKKEITTTRQIETRVKRQVVLEDGEVVKDSGPLVTTNTTEDVEQQEHTTQERKTNGDDPKEIEWPSSSGKKEPGVVVQKELNETVVRSHEETEELLETEDRRQLGDITDEAYQQAIQNNRGDLRISLVESAGKQLTKKSPAAGPKILKHTTKSNKVIDTEKTLERKQLKSDGLIVTESKKTVEHEEIKDVPSNKEEEEEEEEEENNVNNSNEEFETRKESSQRFIKKRDEDIVDYVTGTGEKIAREMRYVSEITEGERIGNWPPPPDTMKTIRLAKPANNNITGSPSAAVDDASPMSRKDALTKKPLDPDEEDEARKFETSKWLENHFGSESRSSHGSHDSIIDHNIDRDHVQTATNKSFINVTMKSYKKRDDFNQYNNNNNNNNNNNDDDNNNNNHYEKNKILRSRELESPSGYFHGISEWSERFQRSSSDKQNNGTIPRINNSPKHQVIEMRTNGNLSSRRESPMDNKNFINRQKESTYMKNNYSQLSTTTTTTTSSSSLSSKHQPINSVPSPPVRTRLSQHQEEKGEKETCPSPVHVVQRTWENRSRHCYSPTRSNSSSPLHTPPRSLEKINQQKHVVARRSPSPPNQTTTKSSKIGQSFRKLVSKLRSASSERKIKKNDNNSVSQVTQTDNDDSTYLQYNLIDKNIPEIIIANDNNNKPPERPPRLPKTTANPPSSPPTAVTKTIKVTRSIDEQYKSRNASPKLKTSPHDRYYTSEQSKYSSSSSLLSPRSSHEIQNGNHHRSTSKNIESNTLGRLSKSTSRLVNDNYYTATQTLPIKSNNHHHRRPPPPPPSNQSSRHYNSMINISIKNSVTSSSPPPLNSLNFKKSPKKNIMTERRGDDGDNYNKSSLLRSKSFNVEANGGDYTRIPYKSNTQLNRLDETPPLKSPGILASISQSNRDLFKHDYY